MSRVLTTSLIFSVILFYCLEDVASVQCYSCTSSTTTGCGDPFAVSSSTTICNGPQCTKSVVTKAGVSVVSRGCTLTSGYSNECSSMSNSDVSTTVCVCTNNVCNSSDNNLPSFFLALIAASIVMLFGVKRH